jgi:hypothetical protein
MSACNCSTVRPPTFDSSASASNEIDSSPESISSSSIPAIEQLVPSGHSGPGPPAWVKPSSLSVATFSTWRSPDRYAAPGQRTAPRSSLAM